MTSSTKSRLLRVIAAAVAATVLLALYLAHASRGRGLPCPLLLLSGLQCPACGMTRATASLLRLEIGAAFSYNALWPLYAVYLTWVTLADAVAYVRRGVLQILPAPRWCHALMLALIALYGVLRNLPL